MRFVPDSKTTCVRLNQSTTSDGGGTPVHSKGKGNQLTRRDSVWWENRVSSINVQNRIDTATHCFLIRSGKRQGYENSTVRKRVEKTFRHDQVGKIMRLPLVYFLKVAGAMSFFSQLDQISLCFSRSQIDFLSPWKSFSHKVRLDVFHAVWQLNEWKLFFGVYSRDSIYLSRWQLHWLLMKSMWRTRTDSSSLLSAHSITRWPFFRECQVNTEPSSTSTRIEFQDEMNQTDECNAVGVSISEENVCHLNESPLNTTHGERRKNLRRFNGRLWLCLD